MDFRDYVRVLRRRWKIITIVLVACLAGAAVATVSLPKTYRTTTGILVALPREALTGPDASLNYSTNLPDQVKSYASIVGTPPAVTAAVARAGVPAGSDVSVSGTPRATGAGLGITVTSSSAATAAAVANAYVDSLPGVLVDLSQINSPDALEFKTLSAAPVPSSPYQPDPLVNGVIGLVLGLILGLAAAATREALDRRIRDSRGVEDQVGRAILGVVPHELRSTRLPAQSHPESQRTEAYRIIRTNLLFAGAEGIPKSIAVTSAAEGEGKTALACNLAVVCARAGQKVALVDADLRRPMVHEQFGVPNRPGLAEILAGKATFDDALQDGGDGITLLPSGAIPHDPSELLGSVTFAQVIEELEKTHDVVIVDTAPTLAVSDGAQVCVRCRGVIVVSRLKETTYDSLKRAVDTLERLNASVLGVVAVGADEDPDAGYHYYYRSSKRSRRAGRHRPDESVDDAASSSGEPAVTVPGLRSPGDEG